MADNRDQEHKQQVVGVLLDMADNWDQEHKQQVVVLDYI